MTALDATLEDPAGSSPILGRAAIEAFYAAALARVRPDATVEFSTNTSPGSEMDPLADTRRALTDLFG